MKEYRFLPTQAHDEEPATVENIHIYHTNKHALFFYNISQYICQLPHIFGLKQVFAQA